VTAKLAELAKQVGEKIPRLHRLSIGTRLTVCFVFIILAMLVGNAVLLWQFYVGRLQAELMSGVDHELIAVLQEHTNLMSFYERLDALARSENTELLAEETEALRRALLDTSLRTRNVLSHLPKTVQLDPNLLPTIVTIQYSLPTQLEAIAELAKSGEWLSVRFRLDKQVRALETKSAALVESVDRDVGQQRAQALLNIERAQNRILLIVPMTAVLSLFVAALFGLAITRSITQPLGRLMAGSNALAKGDFSHRVCTSGTDEIAHLGHVFNDMVVKLRDLYRELHRRETYLAEAQEISHTGSFGWDVSSGAIYWSDETFRIFEFESKVPVTIDMIVQRTHPEDRMAVREVIERVLREKTEFDLEHRLLMPDGSVKYLHVVGRPSTEDWARSEFVGAVTDLTARRRAEEALRQTQARLSRATQVAAAAELSAAIAHEINQPLASVVANAHAGIRWLSLEPPNQVRAREAIERIVHDGNDAAEVVRRIRALFKGAKPKKLTLDLNELIGEVLRLIQVEASRKGVVVETRLMEGLPLVLGDRLQVQQVVLNLMMNGIEAMDRVSGSTKTLSIQSGMHSPNAALVEISDNGVGLQDPDKVFEAFFTTKEHGMGMGLVICRTIIEAHEGQLWAKSNAGLATTFSFTLPLQSAPAQ
jgi:PAS domain S-box-containing protein